jgi:N-methylhydantoinase A/oxoprolinase/acetone carboxylase beta subunit
MRDASQAPRNSRELAVRNQFFTPRYVVEFLVDNTLGRLWFNATGGNTHLRERCQYLLVKPDEMPQAATKLRDPRTLKLIAFGGAGPVHAHEIARALKMQGYICPAGAGVTSALGFLTAPVAFEFARTYIARVTQDNLGDLDAIYAELEAQGRATLTEAGVPAEDMTFERKADMRHVGQGHQIGVELPFASFAEASLQDEIKPLFYARYDEIYGYAHRHLDLEITTCRLTASGPRPRVSLKEADRNSPHARSHNGPPEP